MSTKSRAQAIAPYLLSATGSMLVAFVALQLWRAHLGIPLSYSGDAVPHAMHFEQIEAGWFWNEPRLGSPFGQQFSDWPLPELLHLFWGKFFGIFTDNWAVMVNCVFLIGFPLSALAACWVLRRWNVSRWMATVLAILYSIVPYHFVRGEHHLFLSGYYMAPLGIWLAVSVLERSPLFTTKLLGVRTVAIAVLIALSGVYYAAFTLLFVGVAVVLMMIRDWEWRRRAFWMKPLSAIAICFVLLATVVVATAPTLLYHRENGPNLVANERAPSDSEFYGLKLAQMLMPADGHRIDKLDELQDEYLNDFPIPSERGSSALGFFGAFGLLYLLSLALVRLTKPVAPKRDEYLAALILPAIFVASVGGLSSIVALTITGQIRSWNRISIFIAFAALAAVAFLLDRLIKRVGKRWFAPILAVGVLAVGTVDQTTQQWIPDYKNVDSAFLSDQKYFGEIEERLGGDADVYQLPDIAFPEAAPIPGLATYDPLKPYLHAEQVRWSHGGIKGRVESEWQRRLSNPLTEQFVRQLVSVGFEGVLIDRNGYPDKAAAIENVLRNTFNTTPYASDNGVRVFYDLRNISVEPTLADREKQRLLFPVIAQPATDFYGAETDTTNTWIWAKGEEASLPIVDATDTVEPTRISFSLKAATSDLANFDITWPDGSNQRVSAGSGAVFVTKEIQPPRGVSFVEIATDARGLDSSADARDLHFRVLDLRVESQ